MKSSKVDVYQDYINFFEEIYDTMDINYYKNVTRDDFNRFIKQFDEKIYGNLKKTGKSLDFIRWRSAAFLVDFLKDKEDVFSAFYPPKPAKEYEETALGVRIDLGIEGDLTKKGYEVSRVEPRSDAYIKGLREKDIILSFDNQNVKGMTEDKINEFLNPLVDSKIIIKYLSSELQDEKKIEVISKEYFKQTVFPIEIDVPLIYGLKIERFNRKTSEDMLRFLEFFRSRGEIKGLVLDLRNNPGGPPLAAREISAFFLPPGEDFAYFHKKGFPEAKLDVPAIPEEYHYNGPIVILVNHDSGSAAELFSGILQRRKRAILMGTNSAGQVMLKSMFHFDDESMILLITSRGHYPDGSVFSFDGLIPDKRIEDGKEDVLDYAVKYLIYVNMQKMK